MSWNPVGKAPKRFLNTDCIVFTTPTARCSLQAHGFFIVIASTDRPQWKETGTSPTWALSVSLSSKRASVGVIRKYCSHVSCHHVGRLLAGSSPHGLPVLLFASCPSPRYFLPATRKRVLLDLSSFHSAPSPPLSVLYQGLGFFKIYLYCLKYYRGPLLSPIPPPPPRSRHLPKPSPTIVY